MKGGAVAYLVLIVVLIWTWFSLASLLNFFLGPVAKLPAIIGLSLSVALAVALGAFAWYLWPFFFGGD